MTSVSRGSIDVATFENRATSVVNATVELIVAVGTTLANIEHNTREIFWWTSWAIIAVLGLFIINILARMSAQLVLLNTHQEEFKRLWEEDRVTDALVRKEERRERYTRELREASARAGKDFNIDERAPDDSLIAYLNRMAIDDTRSTPERETDPEMELSTSEGYDDYDENTQIGNDN